MVVVRSTMLPGSTESPVAWALELIQWQGQKRLGFLGISSEAGTDDLRESLVVELIERLLGVLAHAKVIVIGSHDREFQPLPKRLRPDQTIVDLVRVRDEVTPTERYRGLTS